MPSAAASLLCGEQGLKQADIHPPTIRDEPGGQAAEGRLSAGRRSAAAKKNSYTSEPPGPAMKLPVRRQCRPAQQDGSAHAPLPFKRIKRVHTE